MPSEFDLIRRHFTRKVKRAVLGVGDDCALWAPSEGMMQAISTDMLVEGRHFLAGNFRYQFFNSSRSIEH